MRSITVKELTINQQFFTVFLLLKSFFNSVQHECFYMLVNYDKLWCCLTVKQSSFNIQTEAYLRCYMEKLDCTFNTNWDIVQKHVQIAQV